MRFSIYDCEDGSSDFSLASVPVRYPVGAGKLKFIDCPFDAKHCGRQFKCH